VFAFLEALGLNWILAGTDAHAKNYSVLLSGAAVRLAPLYDVASALPYPEMDPHRLTLAMKIGGEYSLSYIGRSNWLRLATSSGVDPDELIDRLSQLSAGAADELSVVCDSEEIRELNSALPGRLLDAVAVRAAECRSRLEGAARGVDGDAARRADDWTAGLATLLIDNLASPQVQTVLAVVDRNGRATPEDLREVLGGSRRNLRGLLGPITKAMSRLQARRLLPMGLAKPLTSHYALDAQGQSRLVWLAMPEAHLSAFREALRSQHLSIAAGGADDAAD
jgi:hypothetical protein